MSQSYAAKPESVNEPRQIMGPYGLAITLENLPPANTRRWVIRRKAEVIAAVKGGLLTREEAIEKYSLSDEEFESWLIHMDSFGLAGLKTTKTSYYRERPKDY